AQTGLSRMAAQALTDRRAAGRIQHRLRDVLAQRLYGLCCGYEDLNDHDTLRADLLMQTAVGRDQPLASSPTLCRLETGATRADAWALHRVLVEHFICSFTTAPKELILGIRAINHRLVGVWRMRHRSVFCERRRTAHANHERAGPGVLGSSSECHWRRRDRCQGLRQA